MMLTMWAAARWRSILESRVREALVKERVHSKIKEVEMSTRQPRAGGYALVIDGPCLRAAVEERCRMDFLRASIRCKAVVCCRFVACVRVRGCARRRRLWPGAPPSDARAALKACVRHASRTAS